jgi:hypothetical protein
MRLCEVGSDPRDSWMYVCISIQYCYFAAPTVGVLALLGSQVGTHALGLWHKVLWAHVCFFCSSPRNSPGILMTFIREQN